MFAKVAILLAVLSAVNASAFFHAPALIHTGISSSSRHQDNFGNFAFRYDIAAGGAKTSHSEVRSAPFLTKVVAPIVYAAPAVVPAVYAAHVAPAIHAPHVVPAVYAAHHAPLSYGVFKGGPVVHGPVLPAGKFIY